MNPKRLIIHLILFISLFHYFTISLFAQEWTVPDDKKSEVSPFRFTEDKVFQGADLFQKNCHSCHGDPTKGNFANLNPSPGDPATEKFRKLTDGELFYKISNGKGAMPQFKNILSENDRWNIISYIRSYHPGYVQPEPVEPGMAGRGAAARVSIESDSINKSLHVFVYSLKGDTNVGVKGVEVVFYLKRYFGKLQIGESKKTNEKGMLDFFIPDDVLGDQDGMVTIIAQLNESGGYGSTHREITVPFGKPTVWIPLTESRAMWNIRSKAPVWLILSYSLTVIGVFITLIYILLQIRKIYFLGSEKEPDNLK